MAIYNAFYVKEPSPDQALRLVTRNRVSLAFTMPEFYRDKITTIPGVREAMLSQWFQGVYIDTKPDHMFARFASEPDRLFKLRPEMRISESEKKAFEQTRTGCIIGLDLVNKLKLKLGDRLVVVGDIFPATLNLNVVGIYDAPSDRDILYFQREYLEQSIPLRRRSQTGTINILANSVADVPRIAKAVDALFANSPAQTKTESESAFALSFISMLGNVKGMLLIICGAVTFTILLVSANTIALAVRERVREVGVLKTLGYDGGDILTLILGEAVAISIIGGAIGVLLAGGLAALAREYAGMMGPQMKTLSVTPAVAVICVVAATLIGLVSAAVPAWQASRMPILEALRSTD